MNMRLRAVLVATFCVATLALAYDVDAIAVQLLSAVWAPPSTTSREERPSWSPRLVGLCGHVRKIGEDAVDPELAKLLELCFRLGVIASG